MKLIIEVFEDDIAVVTEANGEGKKNYFIEGIFMQGNLKNRNGRIYPSQTLEKEMKRYNESFIKTKRALGELNHPQGPAINADRVSHLITDMRRDGDNFVGKAKILGTPMNVFTISPIGRCEDRRFDARPWFREASERHHGSSG
jgi:hypothetical protein